MQNPIWLSPGGERISCTEKIKVMQQNMDELQLIAQDLYEDGILMGIDPDQLRRCLTELVQNLENPYAG